MFNLDYILLLALIPVVPMIISDFCRRKIALFWLVLLAVCNVITVAVLYGLNTLALNVVFNVAVLIYMLLGILLYVYIKSKKISSIKHYMGIGDVIFLLAITPVFDVYTFLYFVIGSCIAALLWWGINYLINNKKRTIPFVGILGCVLSAYLIIRVFK